ncbi:MAG: chemotaxis protein CheW [Lysobacter sp.]
MSIGSPVVDAYLDELLADVGLADVEPSAAAAATPAAVAPPAVTVSAVTAPAAIAANVAASIAVAAPVPVPVAREARPAVADTTAIGTPTRMVTSSSRWLRVGIGRDHYAFELLRVQEVVRVAPIVAMRGASAAVLGVMNLRGRIVPVFDLARWLGGADVVTSEHSRIVVVERDDELIGVLVTVVEDVATLGREHIEPPLAGSAPGAIVGIARVHKVPTVLLDANALFD